MEVGARAVVMEVAAMAAAVKVAGAWAAWRCSNSQNSGTTLVCDCT